MSVVIFMDFLGFIDIVYLQRGFVKYPDCLASERQGNAFAIQGQEHFFKQVAFCHPELRVLHPAACAQHDASLHEVERIHHRAGWLLEHAGIGNHYFFKELLGSQNVFDVANGNIDFYSARRGNIIIDNEITQDFFIGDKYRFSVECAYTGVNQGGRFNLPEQVAYLDGVAHLKRQCRDVGPQQNYQRNCDEADDDNDPDDIAAIDTQLHQDCCQNDRNQKHIQTADDCRGFGTIGKGLIQKDLQPLHQPMD
jgi:hypothetical protein